MERNLFDYAFTAVGKAKATAKGKASKKPGKKEVQVNRLLGEDKAAYIGDTGSRHSEWSAWQDFDAASVMSPADLRRQARFGDTHAVGRHRQERRQVHG